MSEAYQKFELINPKSSSNQESSKAIRVDDVVDTKDNLQSAAKALNDGKMPTTSQITEAISSVQDVKLREEIHISATGQRVAEKLDQVLDSTKRLVVDKNKDNEIQKLIHHSKLASLNLEVETDPKDAKKVLRKAYSNLVVLAQLIVTSSEFRGLLGDLYNLLRDVLQENNVPGANKLPSARDITTEDGQIDQHKLKEAAREVTHDAKKATKELAEDKKDQVYSQLDQEDRHRLEKIEDGNHNELAKDLMNMAIQNVGQTIKPMVDHASKGSIDQAKRDGKQIANDATHQAIGYKNEGKSHAENITSEIQTQAKQKMDQASEAINNISLDDEQLYALSDRFSGIVDEVQSHPEYKKALEGLFEVLSNIKHNVETAANNVATQVAEDSDLIEAVRNAKKAVENFAGHYSLDDMFNLMKEFSSSVETDEKLQNIMHSNYTFILSAFRDKKFIHDDKFNEKVVGQFDSTRKYLLRSYAEIIHRILKEGTNFFTALKEDPAVNRTISDLESLTNELFLDEAGRPTIKYDLLQDFHKFVPVLAKRLQRLEVPRISGDDDGVEYILDNISLACDNILPRTVHVRTDTEFDNEEDRISNVITVKMRGVQASAQNVTFYFNKNTLLGNFEDAGVMHVTIDKEGLDVFLRLSPRPIESKHNVVPNQPNFIVNESKCRINDITVKFQHGKYNLLYKVFNKSIHNKIKRQIETIVAQGIRDFLEGIDSTITSQTQSNQPDTSVHQPKEPLDPRPDGWKSDAFDTAN